MNDKISLKAKAGFVLVIMALALSAVSCNTYRKINYLQDIVPDKAERIAINKGILIQPKDMISIVVSSRNPELALIFNLPVISYQAGSEVVSGQGSQRLLGYVVDNDGYIDFPVLGLVKAAGLTRWELANLLVSDRFAELVLQLRRKYDYVFLDCPPVDIVADTSIIARMADMTIFVMRAGLMDKRALPMVDEVAKGGLYPRMSVVLNGVAQKEGRYGYGRYGYGYGYKYEYR